MTHAPKRTPGTASKAEAVEALLATLKHPAIPVIEAVRSVILAADPRIAESIKWNAPSFYTTEHFATFHLKARRGVVLVLHLGARPRTDVDLRASVAGGGLALDWKSSDRATLTFHDVAQVSRETRALTRLIQSWIRHV